jgi:hypothetical protein
VSQLPASDFLISCDILRSLDLNYGHPPISQSTSPSASASPSSTHTTLPPPTLSVAHRRFCPETSPPLLYALSTVAKQRHATWLAYCKVRSDLWVIHEEIRDDDEEQEAKFEKWRREEELRLHEIRIGDHSLCDICNPILEGGPEYDEPTFPTLRDPPTYTAEWLDYVPVINIFNPDGLLFQRHVQDYGGHISRPPPLVYHYQVGLDFNYLRAPTLEQANEYREDMEWRDIVAQNPFLDPQYELDGECGETEETADPHLSGTCLGLTTSPPEIFVVDFSDQKSSLLAVNTQLPSPNLQTSQDEDILPSTLSSPSSSPSLLHDTDSETSDRSGSSCPTTPEMVAVDSNAADEAIRDVHVPDQLELQPRARDADILASIFNGKIEKLALESSDARDYGRC